MPFVEMQDVRQTTFEGRAFAVGRIDDCWFVVDVDAAEEVGFIITSAADGQLRAVGNFKPTSAESLFALADRADSRVRRIAVSAGLNVAPTRAETN